MMKKIFFILSVLSFLLVSGTYTDAYAQCTPDFTMDSAGIEPTPDSLECIVQGQPTNVTIYFKNFTKVGNVTVKKLRIDSVLNMPCGLSYALDQVDRTYDSGEAGCIQVSGTTSDPVGQYKLGIWVSVDIGSGFLPSAEAGSLSAQFGGPDFSYYVRVKASAGATCPAVDTSSGANNLTASCKTTDVTSINEIKKNIENLTITPNPFNGQTEISFYSNEPGNYHAKLFDVVGKEVYSKPIQVVNGTNKFRLERGDLSKGVYMYTITDGVNNISKRVVIRD